MKVHNTGEMSTILSFVCILGLLSGCESKLLDNLITEVFRGYEGSVRPHCKAGSDTVNVSVQMALRQIIELDEPKQLLNLNIWLRLVWYDCRLTWNASQHHGIDHFIIPQNKVWIPDMTLYDNSAAHALEGVQDYNVKVAYDGRVKYNFPAVITSLCSINVKFFPFDYQRCGLSFGSWAYAGSDVNITSNEADIDSYIRNTEWEVLGIPYKRKENYYPSLGESYPTITYYLNLRRKPLFYVMNMLFPCLLISVVATFGFMLPPDSGEKVNLSITVLLSLAVFQLIVLETIPPSGDSAPFIGIFFMISMMLVGVSCFMTVIVLKTHYKGNRGLKMPNWVRRFILKPLARVTCVKIESERIIKQHEKVQSERYIHHNGIMNNAPTTETVKQEETTFSTSLPVNDVLQHRLKHSIDEILECVNAISSYIKDKENQSEDEKEWVVLAQVFDRLFVTVYTFMTTAAFAVVMIQITGDTLPET